MVLRGKGLTHGDFMRVWVVVVAFILAEFGLGALPVQAQTRGWVQIEAQPTLAEAEARARAWAAVFPDVAGFRMASGWYAIVLGPYAPEGAAVRLSDLRRDNLVPGDSFVALGQVYRAPFWPVGANPADAPLAEPPVATGLAPPPEVDVAPLAATRPTAEPIPGPAPHPEADETPDEARRAEGDLTREEREAVQSALQWFGHYTSSIDGAFGPGTRAAMKAWQTAGGYEPTGVLTTRQRATLIAERKRLESELGLATITEREAGIEIALPAALVTFDRYEPPFVQYASRGDSGVRVVLISQPGDAGTLRGLYDILQTLDSVPATGPRALDGNSFTIEAANDRVASYTYAVASQGLVKGWMLVWEPGAAGLAEGALKAMKASFRPVGARALDPGLVPLDEAVRNGLLTGMEVRRPALSRSGFYITSQGDALTVPEAVEGCTRVTLDHDTEATVSYTDTALGIAVVTPRTPLAPPAVAGFASDPLRPGAEVAVAGYAFEDALPAPALTYGSVAGLTGLDGEAELRRLAIAVRPGDAGGPVVDARGAVIGMLLPAPAGGRRVLPDGVAFAAAAPALMSRLAAGRVVAALAAPQAPLLSPDALTRRAVQMTVLVSCWK